MKLGPQQKVLLLTGPSGSGKSSISKRIAESDNWLHISEDDVWDETDHVPYSFRTPKEHAEVKDKSIEHIQAALSTGRSVVFEFLVYENPPLLIGEYQQMLENRGIPFFTRVLKPSVEVILERQRLRGRSSEMDIEKQRANAVHQLSCLESELIESDWIIDSSELSLEESCSLIFLSKKP